MSEVLGKLMHWTGSKLKEAYGDYRVRCLIDEAVSKDRAKRVLARAKLKKEYPEIYAELDVPEAKE